MTVTISKPAINIREKLTEASAVVPYEQRQFHFDNLVTNGTFDTDLTGWTATSDWSWSSGRAVDTGTLGSQNIQQAITTEVGKVYFATATAYSVSGGSPSMQVGGSTFGQWSAGDDDVTVSGTFVASSTSTNLVFSGTAAQWEIDNISVYPSDGTDIAFTMPKGWKPLHVYDDGVLQREGSAEDYEVTFDGFNYYVKPTVANPGARNTVIGVRA